MNVEARESSGAVSAPMSHRDMALCAPLALGGGTPPLLRRAWFPGVPFSRRGAASQSCLKAYDFAGKSWRLALAFGVRGLDPAFTFGAISVLSRAAVKRAVMSIRPACDGRSTRDILSQERKSGVKPPHSKASRHSLAARVDGHLEKMGAVWK